VSSKLEQQKIFHNLNMLRQ